MVAFAERCPVCASDKVSPICGAIYECNSCGHRFHPAGIKDLEFKPVLAPCAEAVLLQQRLNSGD